jgi:tRNA nucleotidyltransferase (CCA-adding enzyme)
METMRKEAEYVLDVLTAHGYEAYFVGGYVRDRAFGREGHDIDIATSARPEEVMRLFPRTVPTGLKHGTVTVIAKQHAYEVTTFRTESAYEDYRRPREVRFVTSLQADLERRDFTINAMAMDRNGRLIDPFGGVCDMKRKLLRCVGDPSQRFAEDALRMLRAIRFAAEYGLAIEEGTWHALREQRAKLRHIAMERVRVELERMLGGRAPAYALDRLVASGLLGCLKAPLGLALERWTPDDMPAPLRRIGELAEDAQRWALLWLAAGAGADGARRAMARLTFAKASAAGIAAVVAADAWLRGPAGGGPSGAPPAALPPAARWKLAVLRFGETALRRWLAVAAVLAPGDGEVEALRAGGARWLAEMPVKTLAELAVGGTDLVRALNRPPGPWLGRMLDRLLTETALNGLPNLPDALLAAAKKWDEEVKNS